MSKRNISPREFNTQFRQATVLRPVIQAEKTSRDFQAVASDYVSLPTIATRGTWPIVRMIDEDTFVQMAVMAGHVVRKGTNKKGFRP